MTQKIGIPSDASTEQLHIIIGALNLSLVQAMQHIAQTGNSASIGVFKDRFLASLKNGDIDMSLLDDANTYDLVAVIVESAMDMESPPRRPNKAYLAAE
jgi:hypothetical protein